MNRLTSGLAIGTLSLFTATGFAMAQAASDAAASGSPSAAPAESTAPAESAAPTESPAPAPAQQANPSDEPAQAGGMQNTSAMKGNSKKPCEKPVSGAKPTAGCEKPK